jgi:hypothetical protein
MRRRRRVPIKYEEEKEGPCLTFIPLSLPPSLPPPSSSLPPPYSNLSHTLLYLDSILMNVWFMNEYNDRFKTLERFRV